MIHQPAPPSGLSSDLLATLEPFGRYGIQQDAPLASHSSFRIGGPADALLTVSKRDDLIAALDVLYQYQTTFLMLGGGSNVLISDAGVRGLVLLNQCRNIIWPQEHTESLLVCAGSGAALAGLARAAIKRGLAGLTWAVSVPGTVGGAVVGNAGAHGGCIADTLYRAELWQNGRVHDLPAEELDLAYRRSRIKDQVNRSGVGPVVISATFRLTPDEDGAEEHKAETFIAHRRRTQPIDKSAGSIFKNPPGDYSGRLIEAAGLKGFELGGVAISEKHANFIINKGDATAADVIALMKHVRNTVFERFGVLLEPEIQFIGDWPAGGPGFEIRG